MKSIIEEKNEYIRKNNKLTIVLARQEELLDLMSKTLMGDVEFLIRESKFKIRLYTPMAVVSGIGVVAGIFLSFLSHKLNFALFNIVFFTLSIFSIRIDIKRLKNFKITLEDMRKVKDKKIEEPTEEVAVGDGANI